MPEAELLLLRFDEILLLPEVLGEGVNVEGVGRQLSLLDKEGVRRGGVTVSGSRGDRVENCSATETAKGVEVAQ